MLNPHILLISHRGNLSGPNPDYENSPKYIEDAIKEGFDVECDVRLLGNDWYLGHDRSDYKTSFKWLDSHRSKLWCHAKNIEALYLLSEMGLNCFYHSFDDFTLTYSGHIWTYPRASLKLSDRSIAVLPETVKNWEISAAFGICTDEAIQYKKLCVGDI